MGSQLLRVCVVVLGQKGSSNVTTDMCVVDQNSVLSKRPKLRTTYYTSAYERMNPNQLLSLFQPIDGALVDDLSRRVRITMTLLD